MANSERPRKQHKFSRRIEPIWLGVIARWEQFVVFFSRFPCVFISTWREEGGKEKSAHYYFPWEERGEDVTSQKRIRGYDMLLELLLIVMTVEIIGRRATSQQETMSWGGGLSCSVLCCHTKKGNLIELGAKRKAKKDRKPVRQQDDSLLKYAGENENGLKRSDVDGKRLGCCGWRGAGVGIEYWSIFFLFDFTKTKAHGKMSTAVEE